MLYGILSVLVIGVIGIFFYFNNNNSVKSEIKSQSADTNIYTKIDISKINNIDSEFEFSVEIPKEWKVEAVPAVEAINFYNFLNNANPSLEKSQIFVRHFEANSFLTLSTVNILERKEITINGRPAVQYIIEKKTGVANFLNQPTWRSQKHTVTDIRVSDSNPSVFLVIAKNPELDEAIYQHFLESIGFSKKDTSLLFEPVKEFKERITKKLFGTYITPETSPVQLERFKGYHTGVDVEYEDISQEVDVFAITNGTVIFSESASGYGGVLVIKHNINSQNILTLYGHLDPKSLPAQGSIVSGGQKVGVLGANETSETGGERKHLHFGMLKGTNIDFRGYVETQNELLTWYNPLEFY